MEILLLAITTVSLAGGFVMGAAAWRLSREERARSAARVAALAAAASELTQDEAPRGHPIARERLEVEAPVRDSSLRVAAAPWTRARTAPVPSVHLDSAEVSLRAPAPAAFGDSFLGSTMAKPSNNSQRAMAIAASVLFVVIVAGGYFAIYGGDTSPATSAVSASATSPLELVSLRHERREDRLAITGLVRNPVAGAPVEQLAAVVLLFDQQGAFVTSARAAVDFTRLAPGDESPFVITLEAPSNVARYRVSFRNEAGVVPHVDRRGQEPIARGTP